MDEIADWRCSIDSIDSQLLKLLNDRARCACEIGKIKMQNGMNIHNPAREREIIAQLRDQNRGPLSGSAIQNIFESIIDECRSLEKK